MKRSFQKRCAALLALAAMIGLLSAGCGKDTQTGSVSQQTHLIQWISIDTKDIVNSTVYTSWTHLQISFFTDAYLGKVHYDFKEIELVSSNPEVADVDMNFASFSGINAILTANPDEKKSTRFWGRKLPLKIGEAPKFMQKPKMER